MKYLWIFNYNNYIDDIWPQYERNENEPEPDWIKHERDQFLQHRDKNKDNKLDKVHHYSIHCITYTLLPQRELGDWIVPEGHNNAAAEASHLIFNADTDKVSSTYIYSID